MMDKKKILIIAGLLGVVLIGALLLSFRPSRPETDVESGVTQTLGDGIAQEMAASKSDAYRGLTSTDDYFAQLAALEEEEVSLVSEIRRSGSANDASLAGGVAASGSAAGTEGSVSRVFGVPDSPAPGDGRSRSAMTGGESAMTGAPAVSGMSSAERLDYDRRRAEMVRDVLAGGSGEEMPDRVGHDGRGVGHDGLGAEPLAIDLSVVGSSDGIISMLDDEPSAGVGYGIRPFRCMFVRDQKLTSGQRVTLRLLEDYVEGGVRIPANTHLAAVCKIGDRLELQVRSLEMNGRIIPLALDAYDTDGLQGIYCPETASAKASRQASQEAISTAGTTFGGLVGDLASTVLRTGATIARSASGEVSVAVVSGYEFYLVKSERR